ncbi:nucleotidyltransferase family protein [Niallia sp. 03133]|uniref:nucleotidyltransferase family protein n=1 Tax=Niallia sp. 03133 TaxID=3458060 RepID=UPI0040451586
MQITTEEQITQLVQQDKWMMVILNAAKTLDLPDWWICAGFVRAKIWDALHGFHERTSIPDIDVIYFDPANIDESAEKKLELELRSILPTIPWSVKNEARMHVASNMPPYNSSVDAISKFPETATALGVKLDNENKVVLTAPCGIEDVLRMEIRPTVYFIENKERAAIFKERIEKKNWISTWYMVKVVEENF